MKQAEIYYVDLPHPSESKIADDMYFLIHGCNRDEIKLLPIKYSFFAKHWKKLPKKEQVTEEEVRDKEFDRLFAKYNHYDTNPYSSDNDPGQKILKRLNLHHTSMSIGDMIKVGNKFFIVASIGWRQIKQVKFVR